MHILLTLLLCGLCVPLVVQGSILTWDGLSVFSPILSPWEARSRFAPMDALLLSEAQALRNTSNSTAGAIVLLSADPNFLPHAMQMQALGAVAVIFACPDYYSVPGSFFLYKWSTPALHIPVSSITFSDYHLLLLNYTSTNITLNDSDLNPWEALSKTLGTYIVVQAILTTAAVLLLYGLLLRGIKKKFFTMEVLVLDIVGGVLKLLCFGTVPFQIIPRMCFSLVLYLSLLCNFGAMILMMIWLLSFTNMKFKKVGNISKQYKIGVNLCFLALASSILVLPLVRISLDSQTYFFITLSYYALYSLSSILLWARLMHQFSTYKTENGMGAMGRIQALRDKAAWFSVGMVLYLVDLGLYVGNYFGGMKPLPYFMHLLVFSVASGWVSVVILMMFGHSIVTAKSNTSEVPKNIHVDVV